MTTITVDRKTEGELRRKDIVRKRLNVSRIGISSVAGVAILVAAWGGIVAYIGPLFGYGANGVGSWNWNLAHSLMALAPGALGVAVGCFVLAETRGLTMGRGSLKLSMAGLVMMLCGAWFVVGPVVWPVISSHSTYFTPASPMRSFLNDVGYSLGTGVLLAMCGGYVIGWATRHGTREAQPSST